jgi:hypothetical protein
MSDYPEPPYAKAPRKRTLPDCFTQTKVASDEEDAPTSQSSECPAGLKQITAAVLREAKNKLIDYLERQDPSNMKHDPKYDFHDKTPTSSQVSVESIRLSQESFGDSFSLDLLIEHILDTFTPERIREILTDCVAITEEAMRSREKLDDLLHAKFNDNVFALFKMVDECLDVMEPPAKRVRFDLVAAEIGGAEGGVEECGTEEGGLEEAMTAGVEAEAAAIEAAAIEAEAADESAGTEPAPPLTP